MSVNMTPLVNKVLLRDITALILDPLISVLRPWFCIWIKMHSHQQIVLGQLDIHLQIMTLGSYLMSYTKINSKWISNYLYEPKS